LRHVVNDATEDFGPADPLTLKSADQLAVVMLQLGNVRAAETLITCALAVARRTLPPQHEVTLSIINDHGMLLYFCKRLSEAEAALQEAADGRAKKLSSTDPATLESRHNLAAVLKVALIETG
jgi:Flp pilus assembly protein TadD